MLRAVDLSVAKTSSTHRSLVVAGIAWHKLEILQVVRARLPAVLVCLDTICSVSCAPRHMADGCQNAKHKIK